MRGLSRMALCRGCGQEIGFIKTVKGKTMPVDPTPRTFVPEGGPNTYVMENGEICRGRELDYSDMHGTRIGYISHFATCPKADRFRTK